VEHNHIMFGRFLSFLGFIPGLSGLSGLAGGYGSSGGGGADEDMEAGGEAAVSFTPGKALASADAEETPDSRQARITDRDLVWPGKVETLQVANPEPIAYRFDLTVTDLNPAFYIRRPPQGGAPQREGGILLQPGEEASFEVVFVPPPAGEKLRTRTFGFVLTCFDPRRSGDPGEIVQDLPLRWVGLPTESDLQITAVPPVIVTRPWRREARFAVRFTNKSFLPPNVGMTILRAPTKDALAREAETVGDIQQALAARTPGVWQCLLPPAARRGSYYATVRGAASAAGSVSTPLALPRPLLVRYVPWLRMGRDWALLLGTLVFLFWLIWGFPVRKTPVVRVSLNFGGLPPGQVPTDSQLKDLNAQMILLDEHGHDQEGQQPMPGVVIGGAYEFVGPPRWYGFRWPFGRSHWWNSWSQQQQQFRVTVTAAEGDKSAFQRYDLNAIQADGKPTYSASNSESPFGALVVPATFTAPAVHGVLVNLQLTHLGALAGKELRKVTVKYTLDEQPQPPKTFDVRRDAAGGLRPITLDLTDAIPRGSAKPFTVRVIAEGLTSDLVQDIQVQRREKPLLIAVVFPDTYQAVSVNPKPGNPNPGGPEPGGPNPGGPNPGGPKPGGPKPGGPKPGGPNPGGPKPGGPKPGGPNPGGPKPGGPEPGEPGPDFPHPPPATPTGLVAQAVSPTQINVHWDSVPNSSLYLLYRSGGPGGGGTWPKKTHNNFFSDTDLAPGAIYHYRVQTKQGTKMSDQSNLTLAMSQSLVVPQATVALTLSAQGKDVRAILDFADISSHKVYLDKVSACAGGKIGDDVFLVLADGQPLPFTGRRSERPAKPGAKQFITLAEGGTVREEVVINHSYRFPQGTHTYTVTYKAPHNYPNLVQYMTLTSNEVSVGLTR